MNVREEQLHAIIPAACQLGEGILWDGDRTLWWTDIQARQLCRFDWTDQRLTRQALPERLGSFGFTIDGERIIAAFESGIAFYRPQDGALQWLARLQRHPPSLRFNDGRVDRQGRFWAGTMIEDESAPGDASLYRTDANAAMQPCVPGLRIANGLCASPDGRSLYLADSARAIIYVYDLDPDSGELHDRRVFARTEPTICPDGANVDEAGCLWSAQWGGSRVIRYAPDGRVDRILHLPVSQPTCVTFGGPDLDLLFITTARDGLSPQALDAQTHAGDVLVYRSAVKGLAEPRYRHRAE